MGTTTKKKARTPSHNKVGKADIKSLASTDSLSSLGAVNGSENEKNIDEHPLAVGHYLVVKYRDNSLRLAKIIEIFSPVGKLKTDNSWKYYIHYTDFNRRMDEWVSSDRIVEFPSVANQMAASEDVGHNHGHAVGKTDAIDMDCDSQIDSTESSRFSGITTIAELEHDEHEGLDEESLLEHEEITKVKNIMYVQLGRYKMECWYFSPFPKEFYENGFTDCLYFCEFTFRFFRNKSELVRFHQQSLSQIARHPPGNEIYRDHKVAMFEIDGAVEKVYCQNLCYFAKLFLDHKTLYWDVDPFLFYVLCTYDERGYHPVGFFSKEK